MLGILSDSLFGAHLDSLADVLFWVLLIQAMLLFATEVCLAVFIRRLRPQEDAAAEPAPIQPQPVAAMAQPVAEPVVVPEEEDHEAGIVRYDRSFLARMIQSDDETKNRYNMLKNELLGYKGVKSRVSWKRETFKAGKNYVARFAFRGKTLCLFVPLDAAEYAESSVRLETVENASSYAETPSMIRIKKDRHARLSLGLLTTVAQNLGLERIQRQQEDYYMPYEGTVQLLQKGLIKRELKTAEDEAVFNQPKQD